MESTPNRRFIIFFESRNIFIEKNKTQTEFKPKKKKKTKQKNNKTEIKCTK